MIFARFQLTLLCLAVLAPLAVAGTDGSSYSEVDVRCGRRDGGKATECQHFPKVAGTQFLRVVVYDPMAYSISLTVLQARLPGDIDWLDLRQRRTEIGQNSGAGFQFSDSWLATQLRTDTETLRSGGFEFRTEIRAKGPGAGRQDFCDILNFQWSKRGEASWIWRRSGAEKRMIGVPVFLAAGSVNQIRCDLSKPGEVVLR